VQAQNDPDQDLVDFDPEEVPEDLVTIRLADGVEVHRHSFAKSVSSVAFSPHDTFLLASGHDLQTKLWALDGSADAKEMKNDVTVTAATFSGDEQTFAIGALDGVVQLFATADPADELVRLPNTGKITALAFSPDGKLIATTSQRRSSLYEDPAENHALRVWLLDPVALMNDAKSRLAAFGGG
jgi:WD40 repeat protein